MNSHSQPRAMEILMPEPAMREKLASLSWVAPHARGWEWEFISRDGQRKVVAWTGLTNAVPIAGWAFWGTAIDVTERLRAERALRESEARLRRVQELACVGRFQLAVAGQGQAEELWSQEALRILGEPPRPLLAEVVHPDDRARMEAALRSTGPGRAPVELQFRALRRDGSVRHVQSAMERDGGSVVGTLLDVTDRVLVAEARARLASAQEEERRRLTRELHDTVGHRLTQLREDLRGLEACADPVHLVRLRHITDQIADETHRLAWELRPPALDELGLVPALRWLLESWSRSSGVAAALDTPGLERERLAPPLEVAVFRVVQEALTNVLKHARARSAQVLLARSPAQLLVLIEDDGAGFEAPIQGRGMGLENMRARAALVGGALEIESSPGGGTRVFLKVPLPSGPDLARGRSE
jgi:signal transduction histidine kinase